LRGLRTSGQASRPPALAFSPGASPVFLFGWDSPPEKRNVFGLIAANPELARGGIRLRQFGQEVIEALGGRKIHPAWTVPGGVRESLSAEARQRLAARVPEALETTRGALALFKGLLKTHAQEVRTFGAFPSLFMGLVAPDGTWEHYDGHLRVVDAEGRQLANLADPSRYQELIGEAVEPDSYLKSPFYRPLGYPDGVYRVGPLAR